MKKIFVFVLVILSSFLTACGGKEEKVYKKDHVSQLFGFEVSHAIGLDETFTFNIRKDCLRVNRYGYRIFIGDTLHKIYGENIELLEFDMSENFEYVAITCREAFDKEVKVTGFSYIDGDTEYIIEQHISITFTDNSNLITYRLDEGNTGEYYELSEEIWNEEEGIYEFYHANLFQLVPWKFTSEGEDCSLIVKDIRINDTKTVKFTLSYATRTSTLEDTTVLTYMFFDKPLDLTDTEGIWVCIRAFCKERYLHSVICDIYMDIELNGMDYTVIRYLDLRGIGN